MLGEEQCVSGLPSENRLCVSQDMEQEGWVILRRDQSLVALSSPH